MHESRGGPGSEFLEIISAQVDAADGTPHRIEIQHITGNDLEYELEARFLPRGTCLPSSFLCEASSTRLTASEQSCTTEPQPSCTTTQTSVDLPSVGAVDGWEVHATAKEVRNVNNPSSTELALLEARCEDACEDEWASQPEVTATCSTSGAFTSVTFHEANAIATDNVVAGSQAFGENIFTGQSLGCKLATTCCEEFDEHVCHTKYDRVTPGPSLLGSGEEYRFAIGGASEVQIDTNAGSWTAPLTGTVGFSLCPEGNASGACPFYLGSAEVSTTTTPTISVDCPDGSQRSETLSSLVAGITQPAFGVDAQGNALKGFPVRGLSLEANASIGGSSYGARGVPDVNVVMTADASSFSLTNAPVQFMVDCGQHTAAVDLTFDIVSSGTALDRPPAITIDIPSEVTCPSTVSLASTASDPDGDYDRVRWYIDDKLMAPSVSSITMTDDHVFRAVAFDDRGAATTAEASVTCR